MISKRLISALCLLAVTCRGVYAQYNYAQWRIYTEDNEGNVSCVNFRSDYNLFQKQTKEFDGKKYSPIRMLDGSGKTIYCRTEDERIMRYDETEGAEFVLFDFSLGLGRSFSCKDGTELVVYEVKDTLFEDVFGADPATQRLIKLYNRRYPSRKDLWLENFGSLKTSVLLPSELGTGIRDSHVAWWDSYAFETTFNNIDTEKLKGQPLRRTERDDYWRPDSLHCELEGDTLVVSGRLRASGCIWPYLTCVTDGNTITLELDDTPGDRWSGFPSYYFRNEFPGFKPGEYTLSYDNRISITFDSKRSYDIPVLWGEVKTLSGTELRNATVTYYEGTRDDIENADILAEGKTDRFGLYMMYLHLPHDTELTEKDFTGKPISVMVKADGYQTQYITDGVFCRTTQNFILKELPSKTQCDINKDGKMDITDVVGVINTIAGDTRYKDSSDVNSDGRTDITDVVDIINVIAGQ